MATGDTSDIKARLLRQLPPWFGNANTVAAALMAGAAAVLTLVYGMWTYVVAQMRLTTCTGGFLDLFAQDYFGANLLRRPGQSDAAFRTRIQALLFTEKGTRRGMVKALTILTGRAPSIWEPTTPGDNGGYSTGCMGYGVAGAYASITLGAQCLITAYRPTGTTTGNLAGYRTTPAGYSRPSTGYGSLASNSSGITDQDILDTINAVRPAGVACWVNISN